VAGARTSDCHADLPRRMPCPKKALTAEPDPFRDLLGGNVGGIGETEDEIREQLVELGMALVQRRARAELLLRSGFPDARPQDQHWFDISITPLN
jgi:hypothetical protein